LLPILQTVISDTDDTDDTDDICDKYTNSQLQQQHQQHKMHCENEEFEELCDRRKSFRVSFGKSLPHIRRLTVVVAIAFFAIFAIF